MSLDLDEKQGRLDMVRSDMVHGMKAYRTWTLKPRIHNVTRTCLDYLPMRKYELQKPHNTPPLNSP